MQFSVIIEGPISRAAPSEESLSELERYLKSLKRSPEFIEQLKSGVPQVVKDNLTYKQAEVISDRLMEFGLESVIDPPSKSDSKPTNSFSIGNTPKIPAAKHQADSRQKDTATKSVASQAAVKSAPATQVQPATVQGSSIQGSQATLRTAAATAVLASKNEGVAKEIAQSRDGVNPGKKPGNKTKETSSQIISTQAPRTARLNASQQNVKPKQTKENKTSTTQSKQTEQSTAKITEAKAAKLSTTNTVEVAKLKTDAALVNSNATQKKPTNIEPITKSLNKKDTEKKYSVSAVLTKDISEAESKKSPTKVSTNVVHLSPASDVAPRQPLLTEVANKESASEKKSDQTAKKTKSSPLSKSAEEIKSLFNLANAKNIAIETPKFTRFHSYSVATLSLLAPVAYTMGLVLTGTIAITLIGFVFSLISTLSPMLAIILMLVPSLLIFSALVVLSLPLWIKKNDAARFEELKIQSEPKLFMLVTAICKIINAPAPEKISVGLDATINGKMSADLKEFFTLSKELPGRTSLRIGAPLLENLSIKDFCFLTARECGRFAEPQTRRSQLISQGILVWINDLNKREFRLSSYLQNRIGDANDSKLANLATVVINRISDLEFIESAFFNFCERQIAKLSNSKNSVAALYENSVVSGQDAANANNRLEDIGDALQRSIDEIIKNTESRRFANNLCELSAYFYQQNKPETKQESSATTDLIKSTGPIKSLINNMDLISEKLTLGFYQRENIVVSTDSLLSVSELFKRNKNDSKQEKIAKEYLCNWSHGLQFWKLPKEASIKDIDEASKITKLNNCIEKVRYLSPDRTAALDYYYKLLKQLTELKAAKKVKSAGSSFRFQYCNDPSNNLDREIKSREIKLKEYADDINLQNCVMGERIGLGLLLNKDSEKLSAVLYSSLTKLHTVCEKLNLIAADADELNTLQSYKPKQNPQHYQLHMRELTERLNGNCKLVQRKLSDCLFNLYDKKRLSIDDVISDRMLPFSEHTATQLCLEKAKVTLATVSAAFQHSSEIAANLATKSETSFKIETVKKL